MLFSQIPGLKETKRKLINSVKNNKVAHGQLFFGTEGGPNLAMALAYSTYINCEEKGDDDSCGVCPACSKINKLIHPDFHFVFPISTTKKVPKDASCALFMADWRTQLLSNPYMSVNQWGDAIEAENKQLSISAEEGRNIIRTLALKSFEATYKIMIIWLPENMHPTASNAILKILEEPPAKTVFILVTNHIEKLLATILSRTQQIKIPSFDEEDIRHELVNKFQFAEKKAQQVAYLSDGNMNEALRLSQDVEEDNQEIFRDWMRLCYKKNNIPELVSWSDTFQKLGREGQKNLLQYGLNIMRECLVYNSAGHALLRLQEADMKFVEGFAKIMNESKVEFISKQLNEASYHIERNANGKIVSLDMSLQISTILKK